jgi:tetratricopeptide (TPR) repeat protein
MSKEIERAIEFYDKAYEAEKQGNIDRAEVLYMESRELFEKEGGVYFIDAANIMNTIAFIKQKHGDYDGALRAARESAEVMKTRFEGGTRRDAETIRLQAWGIIGNIYRHMARYEEAERILQCTLEYATEKFGGADEETSTARNHLGILYKYTGEFKKAEKLYRDTLKSLVEKHGEMNSSVAVLYHNLGGLFHARGDFAAGEPYARKAWEINSQLLGEDDPITLADAAAYAGVLDGLERYDESERIYQRVLEKFEIIYGTEHYEIVVNLNNLANVRFVRGDYKGSETLFRRTLAIKEKILGVDHPDTALTANNLGVLLQSLGRREEAGDLFRRALVVFESQLGLNHPKTLMARENLAAV